MEAAEKKEVFVSKFEMHEKYLKEVFERLVKNRTVLCNEKGQLRKENYRYRTKYQELVYQVVEAIRDCIRDDFSIFAVPATPIGHMFLKSLEIILKETSDRFVSAIKNGTYEDVEKQREVLHNRACALYCDYIFKNGMHAVYYE